MAIPRSIRAIKRLFLYTLTIEVAAISTTADPLHPGGTNRQIVWSPLAASHTGIACAWQRLASRERAMLGEQVTQTAGTLLATDYFLLDYSAAPATLLDRDSVPAPEAYHRFTTIKAADGTAVDAGPFDIQRIVDLAAGSRRLLFVEAKRVQ